MAALVSGHNTYTQSPLSDTPVLHYDRHEFNFHSDCQTFSISSVYILVSFIVTSLLFPPWQLQFITGYRTHCAL